MKSLQTIVFSLYLLYVQGDEELEGLDRGFGAEIKWVPWNDTFSTAKLFNKPVFLLIHKSWCASCQALKNEFKNSNQRDEFIKLSKKFIMVNTEDDEEPEDEKYASDGRYIPRLFFLDTNGDVLEGTENSNYPDNRRYFPRIPEIIEKMEDALEIFGKHHSDEPIKKKVTEKLVKNKSEKQQKERGENAKDKDKSDKSAMKRKNEL